MLVQASADGGEKEGGLRGGGEGGREAGADGGEKGGGGDMCARVGMYRKGLSGVSPPPSPPPHLLIDLEAGRHLDPPR